MISGSNNEAVGSLMKRPRRYERHYGEMFIFIEREDYSGVHARFEREQLARPRPAWNVDHCVGNAG